MGGTRNTRRTRGRPVEGERISSEELGHKIMRGMLNCGGRGGCSLEEAGGGEKETTGGKHPAGRSLRLGDRVLD